MSGAAAQHLTFIVPVRHPSNCTDWPALKRRLEQTIRSIAAQDDHRWSAVIVANTGSDLPVLPGKFRVKQVDFPPNPIFERGAHDLEAFRDACRLDKGRRVLAGILEAGKGGYTMVVDDDDFVSCRLAGFVADRPGCNGWYVYDGYLWGDGGRLLYEYADFSQFCGSSHIVCTALYELPTSPRDVDPQYVRQIFGSHVFAREYFAARDRPLETLPFAGAVYRIGHAGAHSKSAGLLRQVLFKREVARSPLKVFGRLARLRWLGADMRRQFWGNPT